MRPISIVRKSSSSVVCMGPLETGNGTVSLLFLLASSGLSFCRRMTVRAATFARVLFWAEIHSIFAFVLEFRWHLISADASQSFFFVLARNYK